MPLTFEPADIRYVAYLDEAGDPGLARVRPIDSGGATEWLCVGAILVQAERRLETVDWQQSLRSAVNLFQSTNLHFRNLEPHRKGIVCEELARLPIKVFAALSNKKNMLQYRNERAERARPSSQAWFYNWCLKLLMERITDFVEYNSTLKFGEPKHVQFIFSNRGGVRYSQTNEYHELVRQQARAKTTLLKKRIIKWRVLHPSSNRVVPHDRNAGVQLADVVASSFYQAANTGDAARWDTRYAKSLKPLIPTECGECADYGVTLFPHWSKAKLTPEQQQIFRFYGYPLAK